MKHILVAVILVSILGLIINSHSHNGMFAFSLIWASAFLFSGLLKNKLKNKFFTDRNF